MKHLLLLLFAIGLHAQDKALNLPAADQIQALSKQEAKNLLPVLFNALEAPYSETVGMPLLLALYALSRRSDSGEVLGPHVAEIFSLYGHSDGRYKATVNLVFANLNPPSAEAVSLLARFVTSNVGTAAEKVDALTVFLDITRDDPRSEAARLHVLNLRMDPGTRHAALLAAARPGATKKVTDLIAQDLEDAHEGVQLGAIQALALLGNGTVNQYRAALTKITQYGATPTVRRLAQDVLDGKDLRCTTLQGQPIKPCN